MEDSRSECCELSALLEVVRLVVEEHQTLPPPSTTTAPLNWPPYEALPVEGQSPPMPQHSHGTRARARAARYDSGGHGKGSATASPQRSRRGSGTMQVPHGAALGTSLLGVSPSGGVGLDGLLVPGMNPGVARGGNVAGMGAATLAAAAAGTSSSSTASRLIPGGPCFSCGTTLAPQWRRPDAGAMLLCNRCGIHYTRYRTLPGPKRDGTQVPAAKATPPASPAVTAHPAAHTTSIKRKNPTLDHLEDQDTTSQISSCAPPAAARLLPAAQLHAQLQAPGPGLSSSAPSPYSSADVLLIHRACAKRHTPAPAAVPGPGGLASAFGGAVFPGGLAQGIAAVGRSHSHTGAMPRATPTSSDTSHGKDQDGLPAAGNTRASAEPGLESEFSAGEGGARSGASRGRNRSRRHSTASMPAAGSTAMETDAAAGGAVPADLAGSLLPLPQLPQPQQAGEQLVPSAAAAAASSTGRQVGGSQHGARGGQRQPHLPSRLATASMADEAHGFVPYPTSSAALVAGFAGGVLGPGSLQDGLGVAEQPWARLLTNQSAPIPIPGMAGSGGPVFGPIAAAAAGGASGQRPPPGGDPAAALLMLPKRTSRGPSTSLRTHSAPCMPLLTRSGGVTHLASRPSHEEVGTGGPVSAAVSTAGSEAVSGGSPGPATAPAQEDAAMAQSSGEGEGDVAMMDM